MGKVMIEFDLVSSEERLLLGPDGIHEKAMDMIFA
jgi:hypothetical protein